MIVDLGQDLASFDDCPVGQELHASDLTCSRELAPEDNWQLWLGNLWGDTAE